jgi:hypothetical protein
MFALIVPRPLYIPILLWLWFKEPRFRRLMLGTAMVIALLTIATGFAWSWLQVLAQSGDEIANTLNMAPSRFIGYAWVPFGIAGMVWALRRGRIGLASLLASPYWLPYYFVMVLLDLREPAPHLASASPIRADAAAGQVPVEAAGATSVLSQ